MLVKLEHISFTDSRVLIDVKSEGVLSTNERLTLQKLLQAEYPNIKNHPCKNSHGPTLGDCMQTTSIAHILEHAIMEECLRQDGVLKVSDMDCGCKQEVSDMDCGTKFFVGKTANLGEGLAKIELKYYDDIFMLEAIKRATDRLNNMLEICKE